VQVAAERKRESIVFWILLRHSGCYLIWWKGI